MERVRARDLLVVSYVSSYDDSNNPTVTEGENMQSVKKNSHTLVEQWCHYSSGGAEQFRVSHKWSAGLNPTVFQDDYRRSDYKDPVFQ